MYKMNSKRHCSRHSFCRNPTWESVRMKFTLPKWGLGSPLGLPKLQSLIVGDKTPRIGVFFISLESYWSLNVEMASQGPFGHLQYNLWQKERLGIKLAVWLPTTKSRESTRPRFVQVECDTLFEISWGELQVCFKPHPNWRSEQKVMIFQSPESLNRDSFGTPPWEFRNKKPFGCGCRGET